MSADQLKEFEREIWLSHIHATVEEMNKVPYNPLVRHTSLLSAYSYVRRLILLRMTHPLLGGCS